MPPLRLCGLSVPLMPSLVPVLCDVLARCIYALPGSLSLALPSMPLACKGLLCLCSHERLADMQARMIAAALVNTVKSWRIVRGLAVLLDQRRSGGRGKDLVEMPHEHVLQVLQPVEDDLPLVLALLASEISGSARSFDRTEPALAAASSGAALAITVSIAARTAALCKRWQQAPPREVAKEPASQSISQSSTLTRQRQQQLLQSPKQPQQQEQQQQQQLLLAAAVAARLVQSKAALDVGAASAADDLALSTPLFSELGWLAARHADPGAPQTDPALSQQSEQEEQEILDDLLSGLAGTLVVTETSEAAAVLAAACFHTKLPPALQGAWRGSAAVSVCVGPNCVGNGHGIPLILKVYADLCSVAAAAPVEDRAQRRQLCEEFRTVLLHVLKLMPAPWKCALPPPPLWPPTAAEAAAAAEQAKSVAAAKAASDTMMRLLLEVCILPVFAGS